MSALRDLAVAVAAWDGPSALAEFSVRGLGQILSSVNSRGGAASGGVRAAAEHYGRSRWVGAALDDEVNVWPGRGGETAATGGSYRGMLALEALLTLLSRLLGGEDDGDADDQGT